MFQNITESAEAQENTKINKMNLIMKEFLKAQNLVLFVLTLVMSMLSIEDEIAPFGLAMFGVILAGAIGTFAGNGIAAFLNFVLSSIIYFALVLIFKPKVAIEERNELLKTGKKLFLAVFLVSFFQNIKGIVLTYDVFMALVSATLTYVFYKIFVNRTSCYQKLENKKGIYIRRINWCNHYCFNCQYDF